MVFFCLYIVRIHKHLFLDGVCVYAFEFLARQCEFLEFLYSVDIRSKI